MQPFHSFHFNNSIVFQYSQGISFLHFAVGRNYGNAVQRNIFKRRSRYLYSILRKENVCLKKFGLLVRPTKQLLVFEEIKASFQALNKRLGDDL